MQSRFKIIDANFPTMSDKFVQSSLLVDDREDLETNEK